ncbi:AbrB family transcriptional regulator [Halomonas sp. McH1-25]|uniref:AbrB family transcriptional regulator n=1 Tax=unclassified Halomonas TaxID=2609666 RepID=UPI001EF47052|nr:MULTISPECIES: AbrB family transcriptional regulator [unclassified Halomonas]MCG7599866.1 AbrB family transcriptional regulator [Halomonas sp. McH1-25]MCP1343044.1 AbrB family transcriptional regulator [Halomonas sp. FL8]MCP1361588.1 AbrB family transcriptional regulator [Halomonas sp. BBD45]MCP1365666.1 AbrB family transcriptional regulator [Halomonas sp. BBD48]
MLPTLAIGAVGGSIAYALEIPLPWLLGALIATTVLSLGGVRLRAPTTSRKAVLVVIGVMLGAAFTPDMTGDVALWSTSLVLMLLTTAVMMAFSVWFGRRIAGYSMDTAMYSGVPGGVSAVTMMAADSQADLRVVGLTHAVRILVLLLAIPPVLSLIGHVNVQSRAMSLAEWLSMPAFGDTLLLIGAGVIGMWLGRRLHLPNPLLFGPVLLSGALHVTGVTEAAIPPTIVALAQIIIGVSVGVRFGGTSLATVGVNLLMAVLQAVALLLIAIAAAWLVHALTGYSAAAALLAYMPGGAPELSLVALSLGIDPAFVTSHHLLRITVLIMVMPLLLRVFQRRRV